MGLGDDVVGKAVMCLMPYIRVLEACVGDRGFEESRHSWPWLLARAQGVSGSELSVRSMACCKTVRDHTALDLQ